MRLLFSICSPGSSRRSSYVSATVSPLVPSSLPPIAAGSYPYSFSSSIIMSFPPPPISAEQSPKRPHLSVFSLSFRQTPSHEPPAYSPHDTLADRYQRFAGYLHWTRVTVSVITFIAGIVIIACASSALRLHSSTQLDSQFMLPLWPSTVDLRPTHAILACGVLITIFSLIYLLAAFLPTVRSISGVLMLANTNSAI